MPTSEKKPNAKKAQHDATANGTSSVFAVKRVFLFLTVLLPFAGILFQQLPSFVVTDTACRWIACVLPQDAAVRDTWILPVAQHYASHHNSEASTAASRRPDDDALWSFGSQKYNATMYWGTYRPNVLMGVKGRTKHSLLVGLAWYDAAGRFGVRHDAAESGHLIFRWEAHDGVFFGTQRVMDNENKMECVFDFVKVASDGSGWDLRTTCRKQTAHALVFAVYFVHEGSSLEYPLHEASTWLRASPPGSDQPAGQWLEESARQAKFPLDNTAGVTGTIERSNGRSKEAFAALVSDSCPGVSNRSASWTPFLLSRPAGQGWAFDIRNTPRADAKRTGALRRSSDTNHVVVFKKTFTSDFRIHTALRQATPVSATDSGDEYVHDQQRKETADDCSGLHRQCRLTHPLLTECQFTSVLQHHTELFEKAFERRFCNGSALQPVLPEEPATSAKRHALLQQHSEVVKMLRSAMSNMIGGMGHWVGRYIVVPQELDEISDVKGKEVKVSVGRDGSQLSEQETTFDVELFSAVPSRAKFPRGFLWDEGFHQLLLSQWDAEISKDVIAHWLINAMASDGQRRGWIPREQILGPEARSRVPREFTAQHPMHANPPSLVLAILSLVQRATRDPLAAGRRRALSVADREYFKSILPRLIDWRDWYHQTQCGGAPNCSAVSRPFPPPTPTVESPNAEVNDALQYRWRSRNNFHLLACGLDDYPRPVCKGKHRRELHVDLMSWMSLMTRTIREIEEDIAAAAGGDSSRASVEAALPWEAALNGVHWDDEQQRYADVSGCFANRSAFAHYRATQSKADERHATRRVLHEYFSPFVGYVSLFPLLTQSVEDPAKAKSIIRLARSELSTGYGLASLSTTSRGLLDAFQVSHENYWTGPIWMNINYLFLRALKQKYIALLVDAGDAEGGLEAAAFYEELRVDLLFNVVKQFRQTGKLWENYHWVTGNGQGTAPFTGWTALVVLMMGEAY